MRFRNLIFTLIGVAVVMLSGLIWTTGHNNKPENDSGVERRLDGNSLALVWTFDAGGPINSLPLRADEVVLTAPSGGPIMALAVETGALRWQYSPPERMWDRAVAADDRRVFVGLAGGRLIALEANTGKVLWQKDLGIDVQYPPLVDGGVLYVPTTFVGPGLAGDASGRARAFALAADDGRELWSFETGNYILQTPFRFGNTLYVGGSFQALEDVEEGGHMRLYALAADDGMARWTYESTDGFVKRLYATDTVVAYVAYQDFVTGLDAATGELRWRVEAGNWVPSLSGAGDTVYFGSDNTVLEAHDMNDGRLLWAHNISEGVFNYVMDAPVRVQDDLYFITQRGDIVALNAVDGTLRWQVSTGIKSRGGLTVADGWLFVGGADGSVSAFTGTR